MLNFLQGKKTYIVVGATLVYAVLGVVLHFMDMHTAIGVVLGALGLAGLRNGVSNQ